MTMGRGGGRHTLSSMVLLLSSASTPGLLGRNMSASSLLSPEDENNSTKHRNRRVLKSASYNFANPSVALAFQKTLSYYV